MKERLKSIIKNNKGMETIHYVYILIIVVILLAFTTDVIKIVYKHYRVTQYVNEITRLVSIQGGVVTGLDDLGKGAEGRGGFVGGGSNYLTYQELNSSIITYMNNLNIKSNEWSMTISGTDYDPITKIEREVNVRFPDNTFTLRTDYGKKIKIVCSYKYKWELTSHFIPFLNEGNGAVKRTAVSTFKYDYDTWGNEL